MGAVVQSGDLAAFLPPTDTPLVAVYCGSRSGASPFYAKRAYDFGASLAQNGLGVVYGGAAVGLMGAVADGALAHGGVVVGAIPEFLQQKELAHTGLFALYVTDTMHTRKSLMAQFARAFVALPGGFGTLEELAEIATWRQLGQHNKATIVLNGGGYYDGLKAQTAHAVDEGFMSAADADALRFCSDTNEAIALLRAALL